MHLDRNTEANTADDDQRNDATHSAQPSAIGHGLILRSPPHAWQPLGRSTLVPFRVETIVMDAVRSTLMDGPLGIVQQFIRSLVGIPKITPKTSMRSLRLNEASYVHLLHGIALRLANVGLDAHINICTVRNCKTIADLCSYVSEIVTHELLHRMANRSPGGYRTVD